MEPEENRIDDEKKQYREYYLRADINLSSLVILIWLATVLAFIPIDYRALGVTREFFFFLAARLIFIVGGIAVLLGIYRTTDSVRYDRFISLLMFMAAIFSILGSQVLEQDFIGQLIMNVLVIISIYAIIPGPVAVKFVVSMILSIVSILKLYKQEQALIFGQESILTGIIITNILGLFAWYSITQIRHRQFQNHQELQTAKKQAEFLARTDPLTETYNRRVFMDKGEEEFTRAHRYQRAFSIIVVDLDNFKSINDRFGHQAGDLVLKILAQQVSTKIRKQDSLARLGGDEFGILLPETDKEPAAQIAGRVCEDFRQTDIPFHDIPIKTSLSAGVATKESTDESFDELFNRADQRLYQAKQAGKNCIQT